MADRAGWTGGPVCRPYGPHPPRATARVAPTVRTNRSYNRDRSPHPSRCACHLPQRKARAGLRPAPAAYPETVHSYRRGRTPAGPQIHAARPGGRALQPSISRRLLGRPKCRCGTTPAAVFADSGPQRPGGRGSGRLIAAPTADNGPFLENGGRGHTPGWLLSAFGRFTFSPSPTGFKKIFRDWVGEALGPPAVNRPSTVGSTNPGAVVKSQPLQFSTRPGPSGPKEIAECHSNFARRKYCKPNKYASPVMGSGESGPMDLGGA